VTASGNHDKRIRLLTISKPYVSKAYRKKLLDLASDSRFLVGLVCPVQWGDQTFEGASDASYKNYKLPILFNGKNHFHFYLGLNEAIRDFKPDILNIEEEHYSIVTWQAMRAGLKVGAKCFFYTWQNIHKSYPSPFSWIEQFVFRHASGAMAGNLEALEILRAKGFTKPILEIPQMGTDIGRFTPDSYSDDHKRQVRKKLGLDTAVFWISYFGRLVPEKGVHHLLDALAKLRQGRENIRLLIVGSGPEEAPLRKQANELALGSSVVFLSQIASTDVPEWLQAMDVLCLPSLTRKNWKEQFGRVLVEAMAAGTVVVGSSSGEIPRVIGKAGLVTHEGDSDALAGAIEKLADQPTLWRDLQELGRERVLEKFSDAIIAKKTADFLYGSVQNTQK
jgi:glycosyltransferase involved in cell wall biosynthesis